tara:strand:- start:17435 stop:17668 length:234 start_codon:yes stop_codon:yes gene_type:complete
MQNYQTAVDPQLTNGKRPILTVRHPDVETLLKGLPATTSDNWDVVRPWALGVIRARNDWSVRSAKTRIPNALSRGWK